MSKESSPESQSKPFGPVKVWFASIGHKKHSTAPRVNPETKRGEESEPAASRRLAWTALYFTSVREQLASEVDSWSAWDSPPASQRTPDELLEDHIRNDLKTGQRIVTIRTVAAMVGGAILATGIYTASHHSGQETPHPTPAVTHTHAGA